MVAIPDLVDLSFTLDDGISSNAALGKPIFQELFLISISLLTLKKNYICQENRRKYLVNLKTKADAEGKQGISNSLAHFCCMISGRLTIK